MRFYAERPGRLAWQLLADVLVAGWVVGCVTVAMGAQDLVLTLQGPGNALVSAGETVRGSFDRAASTAERVPLVGDDLAAALRPGSGAGTTIADAGHQTIETVDTVALGTAIGIVVLLAVPVVLVWVALRLRYARRAGDAVAIRDVDTDLLALRALTHVPLNQLLTVSPDPAAAWRRGDRAAVHGMAALQLRSLGLHASAPPR